MAKLDPICSVCKKPVPGGGECPWCAFREGRVIEKKERLRKKAARVNDTAVSTALLICFNGHKWRTEVDPKKGVNTSALACPVCGGESRVEDILKIKVTSAKCRSRCWLATDPFKCICSCGGANHGTGGPPLADDESAA